MLIKTIGLLTIAAIIISCNVRSKDKIAGANPLNKQVAITDPTTVLALDTLYDFGTINQGDTVQHNFRFVNTGTKPLIITDTRAQCGCTVPEKPDEPIQPGDTSMIKVKFNSAGKEGQTVKTVDVLSNAEPIFPKLTLKGIIQKN